MPNQRKNGYLGSPDFLEPHIYALSLNGKVVYIGKSSGGKRGYFSGGVIPNKIGKERFIKGVIEYCKKEELNNREIHWISLLNPRFNIAKGGQGGLIGDANPSKREDVRKKISASNKGRVLSEEHKQKLREAKLKNPVRYWSGKTRSKETRNKISNTFKEKAHEHKRSCEIV
jgi:hypothetical protein